MQVERERLECGRIERGRKCASFVRAIPKQLLETLERAVAKPGVEIRKVTRIARDRLSERIDEGARKRDTPIDQLLLEWTPPDERVLGQHRLAKRVNRRKRAE